MKMENEKINMNPQNLIHVLIGIVCIGLLPTSQAVLPAPDGGYPGGNTAEGLNGLFSLTTGGFNTAVGFLSLYATTAGSFNTAVGSGALDLNTANNNTAIGAAALLLNTNGNDNTAVGTSALAFNTASGNTANGVLALSSNTVGSDNVALGDFAGSLLTAGNGNIEIGNPGVAGEANTTRVGTFQTRAFIAGINGTTLGSGTAVQIDPSGQLGTFISSRRFKKDIHSMDKASESIMALKPVTFHYKTDTKGIAQFGLVAEDVAEVNPDLVVRDNEGKPYSVRYEQVNAMLLNEFLKEHRKVLEQQATITQLKSTVAQQQNDFQATAAQQQKQIEALTAGLQKVSVQVEAGKPAPQVVATNP